LSLIVVDSGSTDESIALVRAQRPDAAIVDLGGNRGYAAGVNAGWAESADADALLLLNPDLEVDAASLDPWIAALEGEAGIVVPVIVDVDGTRQPSLRRRPRPGRAWAEALLGGTLAGRLGLGELVTASEAYTRRTECAWATGAAMLISRACLDAVGEWDERYFLYAEETDFCLRAGAAGYATRLEPRARVVHRGGDMAVSPPLYALMSWNRVRLQRKLYGRPSAVLLRAGAAAGEIVRWLAGDRRAVRSAALQVLFRPSQRAGLLPPPTDVGWHGEPE
jgi:GT2 family glycosyltransferase